MNDGKGVGVGSNSCPGGSLLQLLHRCGNRGVVMAADAVGAAAWVKGKISEGLKELGFEKSCDKLSAVIMLAAESKATKVAGKTAAGSTAFNGLVEKVSHKFESVSGKFHPEPVVWTAPTGTKQTYQVFRRTDIDMNMVRTSGPMLWRGKTNLEAAQAGVAPQTPTGFGVQLHHIGQNAKGPLVEVSAQHHSWKSQALPSGKRPFDVLHGQYGVNNGHPENKIDRSKWSQDVSEYWKNRVKDLK